MESHCKNKNKKNSRVDKKELLQHSFCCNVSSCTQRQAKKQQNEKHDKKRNSQEVKQPRRETAKKRNSQVQCREIAMKRKSQKEKQSKSETIKKRSSQKERQPRRETAKSFTKICDILIC
jgi:hypothetical protein